MIDRELLELAAKASGKLTPSWYGNDAYFEGVLCRWNPLLDDGDALRLAVKLYMFDGSLFDLFLKFRLEETLIDGGRSDEEIIRRTFVRVAAEIGRNMK